MTINLIVQNQGEAPVYVTAMSLDQDGRYTHAYGPISVAAGKSKPFASSIEGTMFMVREGAVAPGIMLPRGVPPADIEKPHEVTVDPATALEAHQP